MREIKIRQGNEVIQVTGFASTGEFDKNGKEIFEGDSVRVYHSGSFHRCIIVFTEGLFCLKWPDGYVNKYMLNSKGLEVIE